MASRSPEVLLTIEEPERPHVRIFGKLYQLKLPREGTEMERARAQQYAQTFQDFAQRVALTDEDAQTVYETAKALAGLLVWSIPEDVLGRIDLADLTRLINTWGDYFNAQAPGGA